MADSTAMLSVALAHHTALAKHQGVKVWPRTGDTSNHVQDPVITVKESNAAVMYKKGRTSSPT